MFLLAIVIIAIAFVLLLSIPTPDNSRAAAGLDEFDFPTANQGRAIPELYGTLWVFGNLIWYGNLKSKSQKMCS